ncbi:MAG: RDD family protein [Actinomycetota bacterium]
MRESEWSDGAEGSEWSEAGRGQPYGDRFAGLGIRIGAGLIDGLIQVAVLLPYLFTIDLDDAETVSTFDPVAIMIALGSVAVRGWLVAVYGGTPGKLLVGLKVTRSDGLTTPPGSEPAFKRAAVDLVGLVPGLGLLLSFGVGMMSLYYVATDSERRSVYDRVGGTRVVHKQYL